VSSFELQQTRYDQLVRRVGGVIGPGAKVAEALPELFPVLDVERVPGELLALMGTRLAMGSEVINSAVAEFSTIQLFNPANSGFLITVSSVIISSQSNTEYRWNIETAAIGSASLNIRFRDGRFTGVSRPVGQVRTLSTPAATVRAGQVRNASDTPFILNDANGVAVLSPGTGLTIQEIEADQTLVVAFNWRERVALEAELNF